MKKYLLILIIFFLILSTSLIKNSTKKIEDEIFNVKENLRNLNSELEDVFLEYIYLSSSEKLLEFQSLYFEDQLIPKDISKIKLIKLRNGQNVIRVYTLLKDKKKNEFKQKNNSDKNDFSLKKIKFNYK